MSWISMVKFNIRRMVNQSRSVWARLIEAIDKPLGFFVLALLIVESFLTIVITVADLEPYIKERGMWAGVGLFIAVVCIVSFCAWYRPTHLTFTERGSLVEMGKASYGTEAEGVKKERLPSGVESEEKP